MIGMRDLGQRLRELDKDSFESFVHQYLTTKYPGAGIKKVDGAGGDAGVDSFSGLLLSGPAIWQSKHFPNRIKRPQQRQVLKSIEATFKGNVPSVWILCVPIDLRTAEHKWFEREVVGVYGGPDRIQLLQASDFLTELLHNRNLRDAFFPDSAVSQMLELRKIVTGTEERSPEEIGRLATEFGQQFLAGKMEIEPRLQAVLTVGGTPKMRSTPPQPGLLMSVSQGEQTISYFARDPKAFNLDPITFSVGLAYEEHAALKDAVETGQPLTLPPGKVLRVESSSPLLNSMFAGKELANFQLEMQPRLPEGVASKEIPLRLIAGSGDTAKELYYVPFRIVRAGSREIALSSRTTLPIEIDFTLRLSTERGATLNFRPVLLGAEIQALDKVLQFLAEIQRSGDLAIYSLETNDPILKEVGGRFDSGLTISNAMRAIISAGALVSRVFKVPLFVPERFNNREVEDLHTLKMIASGEEFFDVYLDGLLTKDETHLDRVLASLDQGAVPVRIDHPEDWRSFEVFGVRIQPGPVAFLADSAKAVDVEALRKSYIAARDGEGVPIRFYCEGPCRWVLKRQLWDPRSAFLKDAGRAKTGGTFS
jgi:hypothetical protein